MKMFLCQAWLASRHNHFPVQNQPPTRNLQRHRGIAHCHHMLHSKEFGNSFFKFLNQWPILLDNQRRSKMSLTRARKDSRFPIFGRPTWSILFITFPQSALLWHVAGNQIGKIRTFCLSDASVTIAPRKSSTSNCLSNCKTNLPIFSGLGSCTRACGRWPGTKPQGSGAVGCTSSPKGAMSGSERVKP
jgi:hypothetical protein